jgi:(1->4)-alpha-D-glucan 1-alpha-D-glucosylmutase
VSGARAPRRAPRSTYRLQITAGFPLQRAAELVGYLHRLGADWVYCSPLLQAEPGSDHGYDVIDHGRTDAARGGRTGLAALADAAHQAGLGVLVDIVSNHVGVATPEHSVWWWDVLARGADSPHAAAFDIDWDAGGGRLRLPVLGDGPDELDALEIRDGRLHYYDHAFPIAEGTGSGTPRQVHERQHYELINFRRADAELNYRRFFAVSTLAGIRVELPEVFAASHTEIDYWMEQGWVDGLRVDHPDGLADPAGYLRDLAGLTGGGYTVVEKILEPGEELPADWACAGTTGYDTLALLDRLLVDPAGRDALDELDAELRSEQSGSVAPWADLVHDSKRAVADTLLRSEVLRLARLVPDLADPDRTADAIAEVLACFPVYRSYLPDGADHLAAALTSAQQRRSDLAGVIADVGAEVRRAGTELSVRMQQTSGAVMAKGVEDCAFYRYPRLTSLTEVGGDPGVFSVTADEFHLEQRRRLADWPDGMTTLSTHDTKRGEDVRARIDVLSEIPADWADAVHRCLARTGFPDRVLANLLLQTAVGAWPIERDRLHGYAEKAAREAGDSTGWIDPDAAFEERLHALVDACYDDPVVAPAVTGMADRTRPFGWSNSLAAKLIQLTLPGVPDVYRGTELWQNSLVDPDNRLPVDASVAADLLDRLDAGWQPPVDVTGAAKLLVTSRALRARRDRPELFTGYLPVTATGPAADHLVGFDRGGAVTLATRLPVGLASAGGWGDTVVRLPAGSWSEALTGRPLQVEPGDEPVRVADLLSAYPVALLLRSP